MSGRNRFIVHEDVVHVVERKVWMQSVEPSYAYRTICGELFYCASKPLTAEETDVALKHWPNNNKLYFLQVFFTWRTDNKRSAAVDYSKHEHSTWTNKPWWRIAGANAAMHKQSTVEPKGCPGCLRHRMRK